MPGGRLPAVVVLPEGQATSADADVEDGAEEQTAVRGDAPLFEGAAASEGSDVEQAVVRGDPHCSKDVRPGDREVAIRTDAVSAFLAELDITASDLNLHQHAAYANLQHTTAARPWSIRLAPRRGGKDLVASLAMQGLVRGLGRLVVERWLGRCEDVGMRLVVAALQLYVFTFTGCKVVHPIMAHMERLDREYGHDGGSRPPRKDSSGSQPRDGTGGGHKRKGGAAGADQQHPATSQQGTTRAGTGASRRERWPHRHAAAPATQPTYCGGKGAESQVHA